MTRHYSPYDTTATERFGDHPYEPDGYSGRTSDGYNYSPESDYPVDYDNYDAD